MSSLLTPSISPKKLAPSKAGDVPLVQTCDGLLSDIKVRRSHNKLLRQKDHLVLSAVKQVKALSTKLERAEARQLELQIELQREKKKKLLARAHKNEGNSNSGASGNRITTGLLPSVLSPGVQGEAIYGTSSLDGRNSLHQTRQLLFRERSQVKALTQRLSTYEARTRALELRLRASEKEREEIDTALMLKQEEVRELENKLTMTQVCDS